MPNKNCPITDYVIAKEKAKLNTKTGMFKFEYIIFNGKNYKDIAYFFENHGQSIIKKDGTIHFPFMLYPDMAVVALNYGITGMKKESFEKYYLGDTENA